MRIVNLLINERVLKAELALKHAPSGDVVRLCRTYLERLKEYLKQLHELRGLPELDMKQQSSLAQELVTQARAAVRSSIEITVRETNRTEALLESFTSISIHQAAETLNTFKYKDSNNWEANSSGVRFANGFENGKLSVEEAVNAASRLRLEAYVLLNKISEPAKSPVGDPEPCD